MHYTFPWIDLWETCTLKRNGAAAAARGQKCASLLPMSWARREAVPLVWLIKSNSGRNVWKKKVRNKECKWKTLQIVCRICWQCIFVKWDSHCFITILLCVLTVNIHLLHSPLCIWIQNIPSDSFTLTRECNVCLGQQNSAPGPTRKKKCKAP